MAAPYDPLEEETPRAARVGQVMMIVAAMTIVLLTWAFGFAADSGPDGPPHEFAVPQSEATFMQPGTDPQSP